MTGFKDGASSEGFGSTGSDESDDDDIGGGDDLESTDTTLGTDTSPDPSLGNVQDDGSDMVPAPTDGQLPWIYERNSITDGREKTVQLHLLSDSLDRERQQKSTVEDELGENVKKADLREAALLVGLEHVDEIADQLREWGYDIE